MSIHQQRPALSLQLNLVAEFDAQPSPSCTNLNELGQHLETDANENWTCSAVASEGLHTLTAPYRKRGYFVSSPRSVIDRLKAAAIEFALIAILIVGFIIATAIRAKQRSELYPPDGSIRRVSAFANRKGTCVQRPCWWSASAPRPCIKSLGPFAGSAQLDWIGARL
jgi:hypothetical protein